MQRHDTGTVFFMLLLMKCNLSISNTVSKSIKFDIVNQDLNDMTKNLANILVDIHACHCANHYAVLPIGFCRHDCEGDSLSFKQLTFISTIKSNGTTRLHLRPTL